VRIRFGSDENQRLHTLRHIVAARLDVVSVQEAIAVDLGGISLLDGLNRRSLEVGGRSLEFHAFRFPHGDINVGRITLAESSSDPTDAER
jgi:hypothetical protein